MEPQSVDSAPEDEAAKVTSEDVAKLRARTVSIKGFNVTINQLTAADLLSTTENDLLTTL